MVIEAPGGLGKTRLLQEILKLVGYPQALSRRYLGDVEPIKPWPNLTNVMVSDLIDFSDLRVHNFDRFLHSLRDSFGWNLSAKFNGYDKAYATYRRLLQEQKGLNEIEPARHKTSSAFFEDYSALAQNFRMVWLLDTAEQLRYIGVPWLLEKGIISLDDLPLSTESNLLVEIEKGHFQNSTLIFSGIPEAASYFERLKNIADTSTGGVTFEKIKLEPFTASEVKLYLEKLAQDYRAYQAKDSFSKELASNLEMLADDEDQYKVLHLFTGGQPVSLSMFIDVLAEGKMVPPALQDSYNAAIKNVGGVDQNGNANDQVALNKIQRDIQNQFVNLLFSEGTGIRASILEALVRAKPGLDVDRLHYLLGSHQGERYEGWKGDPHLRTKIENELNPDNPFSLRWLSFVKVRSGKIILQDEFYRIYADYMKDAESGRLADEIEARTIMYQKLIDFTSQKIKTKREEWQQDRAFDERELIWRSPVDVFEMKFRYVSEAEENEKDKLSNEIMEFESERLHYQLRLYPEQAVNDASHAHVQGRFYTDPEPNFQSEIEMWQFFSDKDALPFIPALPDQPEESLEDRLHTLRMVMEQMEVANHAAQLFFDNRFKDTINFVDTVERVLKEGNLSKDTLHTLNHTFSIEERAIWREFAKIYLAEGIVLAIDRLKLSVERLRKLMYEGIYEDDRNEPPFKGHPAENRLKRVLGIAYNNLGFGFRTLGEYKKASEAYATGLRYLRGTGLETQEAVTRNNLSRTLSEQGLITRAVRICKDGLELKEKLGQVRSIAYSHNTLALIYNNGRLSENAWQEAALAQVYFRKLQDRRGLGLSLLQLGEALRRLATSDVPSLKNDKEELFERSVEAILEAIDLFKNGNEPSRYVEAQIEWGCLHRDYMYYLKTTNPDGNSRRIFRYQQSALDAFDTALSLARKFKLPLHILDSLDDLVWTYYYAGQISDAEETIEKLFNEVAKKHSKKYQLKPHKVPPRPEIGEPHIFMRLGKVITVRGCIRMDQFKERATEIYALDTQWKSRYEKHLQVREDPKAKEFLREGAEAFVLAIAYNQLYATRSIVISNTLNLIYNYLKTFSEVAMEDFYRYHEEARKHYNIGRLKPVEVTDLRMFLLQSFGDFLDVPNDLQGEK